MQVLRDVTLLLGRVGFGVLMLLDTYRRIFVDGMEAQVSYLSHVGMPLPVVFAYGALVVEGIGGVLMIVGLFTSFVALAVLIEFAMIIAWTNSSTSTRPVAVRETTYTPRLRRGGGGFIMNGSTETLMTLTARLS